MQLIAQRHDAEDMMAAIEYCHEQRWTDGPTVVPPTPQAVERIINYLKRDPQEEIAIIPPRDGVATIETIAINSVMAGCKPEYVPIVIAALKAMMHEDFNLNGVQTTTHGCAPLAIVSGPAVKAMGFNTREGVFGHGCRASFAIGRAIRLILWNLGGGYPGSPCKTTHAHPGYISFCIGEDPETNPWEPLHVERGFALEDTVVTMAATEGPHLTGTGGGYSPTPDVLFVIADAIARLGSSNNTGGDMVLVMSPMAAKNFANFGMSKRDVKLELMRLATRKVRDFKRRRSGIPDNHPMHWTQIVDASNDDADVPFIREEKNLVIMVAGGWGSGGAFCSVCPTWGAHGGYATSQRVDFPEPLPAPESTTSAV